MSDRFLRRRKVLIAAGSVGLGFVATTRLSLSGSVGGNGGAIETTQLGNNVLLGMIFGENTAIKAAEFQQLATQLNQLSTQIASYMTMLQNLQKMVSNPIGTLLDMGGMGGISDSLAQYKTLYDSVTNLASTATGVYQTFTGFGNAMGRLQMNPQEYMKNSVMLAVQEAGHHRSMVTGTMNQIRAYDGQAKAMSDAAASIRGVNGNIQGLQSVASNVAIGNMFLGEVKQGILSQLLETSRKAEIASVNQAWIGEELERHRRGMAAATTRIAPGVSNAQGSGSGSSVAID